ncbi:hypothetical protein MKX08_005500 [Trichoderma sp. CBMAI-0020]|nr:hypothetical protein MKX08_005500 [Trichoderma sp. CBMAI-0020]
MTGGQSFTGRSKWSGALMLSRPLPDAATHGGVHKPHQPHEPRARATHGCSGHFGLHITLGSSLRLGADPGGEDPCCSNSRDIDNLGMGIPHRIRSK